MGLNVNSVNESGVELSTSGDSIIAKGNVDCADPGRFLNPFLKQVHEQAVAGGIGEVKVDIKDLEFLNSSAISEFTDWILELENLPDGQKYKITFLCNTGKHAWQESSIKTMTYLNPDLVTKVDG